MEMTLLVMKHKVPFMEIPVNYRKRVGVSSVTGHFHRTVALALRMIWLIWRCRLGRAGGKGRGGEDGGE